MASTPVAVSSSAVLLHTMSATAPETMRIRVDPGAGTTIYLGPSSGVSTSNGLPCGPGSVVVLTNAKVSTSVYAITASGTGANLTFSATTS